MKEFMEKYGNDVLTQYKLPTEEELEQLDQCQQTLGYLWGSAAVLHRAYSDL